MARTKQTARYSTAQSAMMNYKGKGGRGVGGKDGKARRVAIGGRSRSASSDSQKSVDLNVQQFSVRFDNQKECQAKALPYYVVECHNCSAFLNSYSKVTESKSASQQANKPTKSTKSSKMTDEKLQELKNQSDMLWQCQFCLSNNLLPKSYDELPPENPCYLMSKGQNNMVGQKQEKGQKLIIYCVDISGSMDTYVENKSRIAAVRQAIGDEIKRMKFKNQKVKIGIVAFGSEVVVYTKTGNKNIPSSTYLDFDQLVAQAKKIKGFGSSINKQFDTLVQNVQKLITFGSTALGPALVVSIELASAGPKGSKIIMCTDGEANVGINGPQFYTKAAGYAKEKGVVVNILSLKGDNCNLKELGKLTLSTGGSILKIDPKLLGSEFNKISKEQILGVQSNLKIKVNHIYEIENALSDSLSADKTIMTQDYGSFNAQTQLTFNFKTLSKEEVIKKGFNNQLADKQRAYMQIQLTYTGTDGSKYLQIITDYRLFTSNKQDLTKELNFGLFSASQLQKISTFIKDQNFNGARAEINYYNRIVEQKFKKTQKEAQIKKFDNKIKTLTRILDSKEEKQKRQASLNQPTGRVMLVAQKIARKSGPSAAFKSKAISKLSKKKRNASDSDDSGSQAAIQPDNNSVMQSDSEQMHLYDMQRARSASVNDSDSD